MFALTVAGIFAFASTSQAVTITNPGANNMVIEKGFLKVGDKVDNSLDDLDPKPSLAGNIDAAGNIFVPKSSFNFGTLEFPVDVTDPISVQGVIGIEIIPTHDVTGTIDPITGISNMRIRLKIRAFRISGSSLLNVGNACFLGTDSNPIDLQMSTEVGVFPGSVNSQGGRRYSVSTGDARYGDQTFSVPGQSGCTGLLSGQINGLLGIPSGAGANAGEFEISFHPAPISNATINIGSKPANPTNQTSANFTYTTSVPSGLTHECRLDAGAWTVCPPGNPVNYPTLADGSHTFKVRAVAGGNDVTAPGSQNTYTWVVDTVIPVFTVNGAPAGLTNNRNANISFSANKTLSPAQTTCTLDGVPTNPCSSPRTLNGLSDGSHTWTVSGTDSAGNSGSASRSWTVDGTKPVVDITSTPPDPSSTASVEFEFTASDNMTPNPVTQCRVLDIRNTPVVVQNWTNCSSPDAQIRGTGKWRYELRATDDAGNVSDVDSYEWVANTAEPVIVPETYIGPGGPLSSNTGGSTDAEDADFEFEALTYDVNGDPIPGTTFTYECWLDGQALGACTAPMTLQDMTGGTPLSEGLHTFEVLPTKVALPTGVPGFRTAYQWYVDTSNPTAAFDTTPPAHHNSATAEFGLDIDGTGSNGTARCKLDNGNWADCNSDTIHTVVVSDGNHTLRLKAVDQAGNESPVVTHSWNADTQDPTAAINSTPLDNDPSGKATFVYNSNDNETGVQAICSLDGVAVACDRTSHTWDPVADGPHEFELRVVDEAGNEVTRTHNWIADTTAPDLDITARQPAALSNQTSAAFKFLGTDGGSGIDDVSCRIDGGAWESCDNGNQWNYYPGPYGSAQHRFEARITDKAGNATIRDYVWKVDLNRPDVAIATALDKTKSTDASLTFLSSSNDVTGYECKLDAGAWGPCSSPKDYSGLSVGNHVFMVRSIDLAGNVSVEDSLGWTIQAEDPTPETCPSGKVGTYPDCYDPCPEGWTGAPPNCVKPPPARCEDGKVGTPPNCKSPLPPLPPSTTVGSYDPATGKLAIRLRCPVAMKPRCIGTAVAVTGKGKRAKVMSSKVRSSSRANKWKLVTLVIKPQYRSLVEGWSTVNQKKLIIRQTVKSKRVKKKRNVFHTYKVRVKG